MTEKEIKKQMEDLADKICRDELKQEPSENNLQFRKVLVHGMFLWNQFSSPQEVSDDIEELIQWLKKAVEQLRDETEDKYKFGKCSGLLIAKIKLQALRSKLNK